MLLFLSSSSILVLCSLLWAYVNCSVLVGSARASVFSFVDVLLLLSAGLLLVSLLLILLLS